MEPKTRKVGLVQLAWLRAHAAVSAGAQLVSSAPASLITALLEGPLQRCSAALVARFVGAGFQGRHVERIDAPFSLRCNWRCGIAISGNRVLLSRGLRRAAARHERDGVLVLFDIVEKTPVRLALPPCGVTHWKQINVAPDGSVLVVGRRRGSPRAHNFGKVAVFSAALDALLQTMCEGPHGADAEDALMDAQGACANARALFVSEGTRGAIVEYVLATGAYVRRFGENVLRTPRNLAMMPGGDAIVVTDIGHNRVSVLATDGRLLRHVGVGMLRNPVGAVCSQRGEIAVSDTGHYRVAVFSASGVLQSSIWPYESYDAPLLAFRNNYLFAYLGSFGVYR